jgi:hypothetical protein
LTKFWSADEIGGACRREGHVWRERLWGPLATIWTFIVQVLHADSSQAEAVAISLAERAAADRDCPSGDPSAYCQARKRLPLGVIRRGVKAIAAKLGALVGGDGRWVEGRRVLIVDGTRCSMPDTPELQRAFGQPSGQEPGCGFPVATIVTVFSWATGAVLDAVVGPWRESELTLWERLWHLICPGDVVVADRFYCTFRDIVALRRKRCDVVVRLHQRRPADMTQGRRLGKNDRLVEWTKPAWNPRGREMTRREWERLPSKLTVRLVRVVVPRRGMRSRELFLATTLVDPAEYPLETLADLYRDRWTAELRLRDVKSTLDMDILRGKSPDVVVKEIFTHLLAYNLIRAVMWQAASKHDRPLHRLSFAGTVARLNAMTPYLVLFGSTPKAGKLYDILLRSIAAAVLPYRPNRVEPRAVKRRPKKYKLLNRPRETLRKELLS